MTVSRPQPYGKVVSLMREKLRQLKFSFFLASVLYVLLGAALLLWPGVGGMALCRLLGAALLLYGLVTIAGFLLRREMDGFRLELLFGVVAAAVGLVFLLQPRAVFSILSMVMGVYVIIDSLVALKRTLALYRLEYPYWWVSLLLSLLGAGLGVVLLWKPFSAAEAMSMLIGAVFFYLGIVDLWSLWKVSRLMKALRERSPIDVDPIDPD